MPCHTCHPPLIQRGILCEDRICLLTGNRPAATGPLTRVEAAFTRACFFLDWLICSRDHSTFPLQQSSEARHQLGVRRSVGDTARHSLAQEISQPGAPLQFFPSLKNFRRLLGFRS